jgi:hypothetical protein
MNDTTRTSPALLALAGLSSGALSTLVSLRSSLAGVGVGFVFGLMLVGYFIGFEKQRSSLRLALFLCICTVAWPASSLSVFGTMVIAQAFSWIKPQTLSIPLPLFFVGGFTGALLVLGAGMVLFGHRLINGRVVAMTLLYAAGCGILGLLGATVDGMRTQGMYYSMRFLLLVWQAGTGLMLGVFLRQVRRLEFADFSRIPASSENGFEPVENPRLVAGVFLACLVGFLGIWLLHSFYVDQDSSRARTANERYLSETPSAENLPPIQPQSLEQALILDEIDGLYPSLALVQASGRLERLYSVGYSAVKDPPPGMFVQRIVRVDVTQVPSETWAQYRVKNPRLNVAVVSPASLTQVQRFGQSVIQDTYGNLCFHWPSGSFFVSVCFDTPQIQEAFVRRYLEKYPSSLT